MKLNYLLWLELSLKCFYGHLDSSFFFEGSRSTVFPEKITSLLSSLDNINNACYLFTPDIESVHFYKAFKIVAIYSHSYFTRLYLKKMGPLQFCLSIFLGIQRNPKQKDFFDSCEGFLMAALTGHGHPGPF